MTADKDDRPRVAFLFGAGASIPAGMRSTKEITERVLSGENVSHQPIGQYSFGPPLNADMGWPDEYVPKVMVLLNLLHGLASKYYDNEAEQRVNYEILYSLACQAYDDEVREYDNPALLPFQKLIELAALPQTRKNDASGRRAWDLGTLTRETRNYIHDVAAAMLREVPVSTEDLRYLHWLVEACSDESVDIPSILTLNHDTVLEKCLSEAEIPVSDGFGEWEGDVARWNPALFKQPNQLKLIKVHGSIDWFAFINPDKSHGPSIYAKTDRTDIDHTSKEWEPKENRPLILIGTISKLLRYTSILFSELQLQTQSALRESDILVVVGYSFGDKGINNHIFDFLFRSPNTRMIIIHHDFESLCANARPAMRGSLPGYESGGQVHYIKKRIENVTWQEIKDRIKP